MIFESHAHLDDERFDKDRDEVIKKASEKGVKGIINVGADLMSSRASLGLAEKYGFICASCGIHPHEAFSYDDNAEKELITLLRHKRTVAVGEIGLDYHYENTDKEIQKNAFRRQINIANEFSYPLIIHDREAHKDCLDILKEEKAQNIRGVFHCYSGSAEMVKEILKLDFYISFTGVVTFKNARKVIEAVREVPCERLLVETDCPYLSPVPNRGKRNHPGNLTYIIEKIADIKGMNYNDLCKVTWENTLELFSRFTFIQ